MYNILTMSQFFFVFTKITLFLLGMYLVYIFSDVDDIVICLRMRVSRRRVLIFTGSLNYPVTGQLFVDYNGLCNYFPVIHV